MSSISLLLRRIAESALGLTFPFLFISPYAKMLPIWQKQDLIKLVSFAPSAKVKITPPRVIRLILKESWKLKSFARGAKNTSFIRKQLNSSNLLQTKGCSNASIFSLCRYLGYNVSYIGS